MSPERAGGASPIEPGGRHSTPNTKAEREAKQKVERVREVDPDEQTKQQRRDKFQSFLNDSKDDTPSTRAPSPFETNFYDTPASKSRPEDKMKDDAIASPGTTAPPNLSQPLPTKKTEEKEDALPHSKTFWQDTDLPPDQPIPRPHYKEKTLPETKTKSKEKHASAAPLEIKKTPESRGSEKKKEEEQPFAAIQSREHQGGQQQQSKKGQKVIEFDPSLLSHASREVHTVAQTVTQQASPYLNPESAALFYQMVGTIYMSLPPGSGINQTVIVLNQAAFANSKFFGATITIEKYATAPDALNIRLTGSNEAVVAFRENIPNLMNAFQNSKVPFKVNRIDAEFAPQRPLFHRKGSKKGTDLSGGMGESKK